ncbi:hypothetical protein RXV86_02355 [Alisedimentitalea sp. MJ-SS2]|uniref:hypothetical protein n=1 Tax=Aliisedimentitalea sp. MJ-SS2 TaxID=3049795 RepID=UPI00291053B0|nr:hypothetical protein [Alisedimentitalea sp. MJ-SS2]MDU8926216.1 hypothetical protein [Alisedimentitalea sp. MJ-SS2]
MGAPNTLAFLVLAVWPLVSFALFRKLDTGRAIIWSLLLGYLFLPPPPAVFDFPLMPPLSKQTMPPVIAFLIVFFMRGREMTLFPRSNVAKLLMLVFVISPLATVLTNGEPVFWGRVGLPALRIIEAISLMVQQGMLLLPFILARNFLSAPDDQRDLLFALVAAGLVYSLPMLIEVRLSPQLNIWIYGYFQHSFDQMVRFGGFRPIVFLYHGLWVAFFALTVVAAAAALWRGSEGGMKSFAFGATGYMWVVLVLCKSVASIGYSLVLVPLVAFAGRTLQFRLAATLALLALAYPAMRGADLVPTTWLVEQASAIDTDRAASLEFRFDNEQVLLDRAREKPVFGWGSWGRNHILDPVSGEILTVTDGRWVITIGVYGWVGFLAEFGLLAWPLLLLAVRSHGVERGEISPWLGPLALILGFNLFDLLPNATITTLTFLISGMMLGYIEGKMPDRARRRDSKLRSMM